MINDDDRAEGAPLDRVATQADSSRDMLAPFLVQSSAQGCQVTSLAPTQPRLRQRLACAGLIVSCFVISLLGSVALPLISRAQDMTSDVIAARKLLMDSIMNNMDKIQ